CAREIWSDYYDVIGYFDNW
nr:immunoglobulin heavy chain junction region [Macaca mulatta]